MKLHLENVRSFCTAADIPIRPLTLLVGDNSSGKTTFLAMVAHVSQANFPTLRPAFNIEPFDLGTYDSIATYKGGRYGRAAYFSVGYSIEGRDRKSAFATYRSFKGQPLLQRYTTTKKDQRLSFEMNDLSSSADVVVEKGQQKRSVKIDVSKVLEADGQFGNFLMYSVLTGLRGDGSSDAGEANIEQSLHELYQLFRPVLPPVFALAPVRTKPRRTYDEISDEFRPEGQHVPVQLARLWQEVGDERSATLSRALTDFGSKSVLFKKVGIKRLGKRPSDPFQLLVTTEGPPANLLDVGYGVSQVLPLIIESVLASKDRRLLLQQPEVHLHPRGQAALGSFFANLVAKEKKQFVIETHSDYILDRIRTEVALGNLSRDDVSVLFFDKRGVETYVHEILIDEAGNVVEAPPSYRTFFMDEELKLLSRAQS